jgi:hypothetical protein
MCCVSVTATDRPAARQTLATVHGLPPEGVEWAWTDFAARYPWESAILDDPPIGPIIGRRAMASWIRAISPKLANAITGAMRQMLALEAELRKARNPPARPGSAQGCRWRGVG